MSHLGGSIPEGDLYTFTPDIWGWILLECDIRSMIDIGCGYGHNARWFHEQGVLACGVEGDEEAVKANVLPSTNVIQHDYTRGPLRITNRFDLALCTEFVEHVEQAYEENWLATLECARWLLMCHAVPGQPGYHHVNCQTSEYWVERLEAHGFDWHRETSELFRSTCSRKPAEWGRPTLLFFGRKE